MNCLNCGNPVAPGAKFCAICGTQQMQAPRFCMQCGAMMEANVQFCPNCGASIQQPAVNKIQSSTCAPAAPNAENAAPSTAGETQVLTQDPTAPALENTAPVQPYPQPVVQQPQVTPTAPIAPAQPQFSGYMQQPVYNQPPVTQPPVQPQMPVYAPPAHPVVQPVVQPVVPPVINPGVAAGVATAAGAAAKGAVKTVSTAKKLAIFAAVVAFLIGAITACLNFFVSAPEDTVNNLVESVSELDYEKMLGCMDSKTENMMRASLGIAGDLMGSITGIGLDFEDLMAFAPAMAPFMETPDLGIVDAETVLYADCSLQKLMEYCEAANSDGDLPDGYLSDNEIISFLMDYNIKLPGLENLIAKTAIVKITVEGGDVGYLPLVNEGWGDWRIPMMELSAMVEGIS